MRAILVLILASAAFAQPSLHPNQPPASTPVFPPPATTPYVVRGATPPPAVGCAKWEAGKLISTGVDCSGADLTWLTMGSKPFVDVREYGALGNDVANDGPAIQAATIAVSAAGGGTILFPKGTYLIGSTVTVTNSDNVEWRGVSGTVLKQANGANLTSMVLSATGSDNFTIDGIKFDGNYRNQTLATSTVVRGVWFSAGSGLIVRNCKFTRFGNKDGLDNGNNAALQILASSKAMVADNEFYSNFAIDLLIGGYTKRDADGGTIINNTFGSAVITDGDQGTNWWDTHAAGHYGLFATYLSGCTIASNRVFGGTVETSGTFAATAPMYLSGLNNCTVTGNVVDGFSNGYGTISVTNGSAAITGTNTYWSTLSMIETSLRNAIFMIEGDATVYRIVASPSTTTSLSVTPVVARATASGLKYKISNTGDLFVLFDINYSSVIGNTANNGHGNGFDIGALNSHAERTVYSSNISDNCDTAPLNLTAYSTFSIKDNIITGNVLTNGGAGISRMTGPASPAHSGISIDPGAVGYITSNTFSNNLIADTRTPALQQYGVMFNMYGMAGGDARISENVFNGNVLYGNAASDWGNPNVKANISLASSMRAAHSLMSIEGPSSGPADTGGTVFISGGTDNQRLAFGYDAGNSFAWVQSRLIGTGVTPLELNPAGGLITAPRTTWATIPNPRKSGDFIWCTDCTIGACATPGTGALAIYTGAAWACK